MRITPEIAERLERSIVIWMTTVTPAGQPQASPVWFLRQDEGIVMYSQDHAPRVRNLRANPRVALNLDGDGEGGDIVTLEAIAAFDPEGPASSEVPAYEAKYRSLITSGGWTPETFARDYPIRIVLTPTRLRSY